MNVDPNVVPLSVEDHLITAPGLNHFVPQGLGSGSCCLVQSGYCPAVPGKQQYADNIPLDK